MTKRDTDRRDLESPLGLADEPIVKTDADHLSSSGGPSTRRRRRARALGEDGIERRSSGIDDVNFDAKGASGIDMGSGGDGTDVDPNR
jgi:hypothetical protein